MVVTNRYKHVGTVRTTNGSYVADARAKATSCLQAYYPLAHRIYGNHSINVKTRISLADSLCFSKMWFGTETWLHPSPEAVRHVNSALPSASNRLNLDSTDRFRP